MANITKAERERRAAANQELKVEDQPKQDAAEEIKYVTMVRDPEQYPEPHSAEVHPNEVDNYRPGGWEIE